MKHRAVHHGTLELLAQTCKLFWPERDAGSDFSSVLQQTIIFPPAFTSSTSAECQFAVLDNLEPLLKFKALMQVDVALLVVSLASDLHGANGRVKLEVFREADEHNRRIDEGPFFLQAMSLIVTQLEHPMALTGTVIVSRSINHAACGVAATQTPSSPGCLGSGSPLDHFCFRGFGTTTFCCFLV